MARILVVDDDPSVRDLLEAVLALDDHEVVCARNGSEGLEWLGIEPFDVVLLDIMMPDLCGYEVLEILRENPARAEVPVIIMSGRSDRDGLLREARFGALDHIQKPFDPQHLLARVDAVLSTPANTRFLSEMRARGADVYSSLLTLCETARLDGSHHLAG